MPKDPSKLNLKLSSVVQPMTLLPKLSQCL